MLSVSCHTRLPENTRVGEQASFLLEKKSEWMVGWCILLDAALAKETSRKTTPLPTAVIQVLHTEAAHIFNKGLDFFISLHSLIACVINIHNIRHKPVGKKMDVMSRTEGKKCCNFSYLKHTHTQG